MVNGTPQSKFRQLPDSTLPLTSMGMSETDGFFKSKRLGWPRTVAISLGILFACYVVYGTWRNYADPLGVDYASFWAAGRMTLDGAPATAYDIERHHAVELTTGPVGLLPFPYPPPFLFFVTPF